MLMREIVAVRSFPAVVQAADIRALRVAQPAETGNAQAAQDFIGGYLGYDERSQQALGATIRSLAGVGRGAGGSFFLNGVYGSGKSHLLGLLTLLADGIGHDVWSQTQPELASLLPGFAPRLVAHFSLDEYDATRLSLEEVFWREVQSEWTRRGFPVEALTLPQTGSRTEAFAALDEILQAHELQGLVVCIDELSLFLSAKDHRALQSDAAFLQFLGQRARRQASQGCPLWIFAAIQKTFEDIGQLEAYSLSQIRDRFTTLPLSLAHLPSLIERRLVIRKDAAAVQRVCHDSFETLSRALPRLDFGTVEWEQLYPFHPATVMLLEQVVVRFFSRTRSAALFCATSLQAALAQPTAGEGRILLEALFDYLAPELEEHPDLRPFAGVWANWRESSATLANDTAEAQVLERLMKALLLFKIAGVAPSVAQVANSIALDAHLPGDGNYEYAEVLLEKLRTRGSYLALERHEGEFADRYAVDLGTRVGEMARRYTQNTLQSLLPADSRIARYAASCCRDEAFPLANLDQSSNTSAAFSLMWRNAPRRFATALWTPLLTAPVLANRLATLAQPGHEEDALLLLSLPFAANAEAVRACGHEALRTLPDDAEARRWRGALIVWTPREPTGDEWALAREATAQHLLESDPQLLDNRRGRAILQHLKADVPQREVSLSRIGARLLREGQIMSGTGAAIDAADLIGANSWTATLESLAEFALPQLFPLFESLAPRMRVLTASNCDALCLDILRRPTAAPFFAPSLERAARAIAEPLGVAKAEAGRWRIQSPREDLAKDIKALVASEGTPLAALEAALAKSAWGLTAEQSAVALCALLRAGDVLAFDPRGTSLTPVQIGMPLRRAIHILQPGELLPSTVWAQLQILLPALDIAPPRIISFAQQEQARLGLLEWREAALAETELAQARLHQLRRQLGHTPAQWQQTEAAWTQITALLNALTDKGNTLEYLRNAAAIDVMPLRAALNIWKAIIADLESAHAPLLAAHARLNQPDLVAPPELQAGRDELLARFDAGESVLQDKDLLIGAETWGVAYATQYRDWHNIQQAPARWSAYRRLAASNALRGLEKLAAIQTRPFEQGRMAREALTSEIEKGCPRDGTLRPGEIVCDTCRLRWGERLKLRDPHEIETILEQGTSALRLALAESPVRQYLTRHTGGSKLLEWAATEAGNEETLLPLLTDDTLNVLNEAFRPRRCVTRSWPQLAQDLATCRTRVDYQVAFLSWLDNNEGLDDDDEIVVDFKA